VDAGQAGEGNLEIFVIAGRENITPKVQPIGNAVFNVSFVPKHQTNHLIHVTFNDENVPGKIITINILQLNRNHDITNDKDHQLQ